MLLFMSYVLMMESLWVRWVQYIANFIWLCTIFSPVLLFTGFRRWLMERLHRVLFVGLWLLCFVVYPLLLGNGAISLPNGGFVFSGAHLPTGNPYEFLAIVGIFLFGTELAIQFNNNILTWLGRNKTIRRFGLERSIIGLVLVLAVLTSLVAVTESYAAQHTSYSFASLVWYASKFSFFSLQFILIGLVYYFFYYTNHYILIPKILKQKGVIYYGFSVAALILTFYPVFLALIRRLPAVRELDIFFFNTRNGVFGEDAGTIPLFIMVISVPIIVSNQWFRQANQIAVLAKEKSETELTLLKQQINPHFFFNTLNNLYALSLVKHSATPEVIMQLSELMRYVIYRGKEELVALAEEIKYIEDYIQLQQIRLHKKLDFQFEKDIEDENMQIPPLLFIILVENAFKHGVEPAQKDCLLRLYLKSDGNNLLFTCENSYEPQPPRKAGIGLENLKRQLALRFPRQHELRVEKNRYTFKASLEVHDIAYLVVSK